MESRLDSDTRKIRLCASECTMYVCERVHVNVCLSVDINCCTWYSIGFILSFVSIPIIHFNFDHPNANTQASHPIRHCTNVIFYVQPTTLSNFFLSSSLLFFQSKKFGCTCRLQLILFFQRQINGKLNAFVSHYSFELTDSWWWPTK